MKVEVKIINQTFCISVGNGHQSIKWLAFAINAKINEEKILRVSYGDEGCLVSAIKNMDGVLLNPKDSIYEHADDNTTARVIAEVCSFKI